MSTLINIMEDYLMFGKVSSNRIFLEHDEEQL